MNSENRKKVLLGFGGLAVVVVVVLALWAPQFRNEEASGAIGAVQKHRAPQIAKQDVILGDEATRKQQNVLYADFLNDAAKLQSISAQFGAMAQSRNMDAARRQVEDLSADVQSRYTAGAREMVAAAQLLSRDQQEAAHRTLVSDIAEASALAQRAQISVNEMEQLNGKLKGIAEQLESKGAASRNFTAAHLELGEAVQDMESRKMAEATARLESVGRELNARPLAERSMMADFEYLSSMALEMKTLKDVEEQMARLQGSASQAENRFSGVRSELAGCAEQLESKAVKSIERQLNEEASMASILRDMDSQFAAANRYAMSMASVESRAQNFDKRLGQIRQELDARKSEFASHASSSVEFELAAIQNALNNAEQAGVRAQLGQLLASLQQQLQSNSALAALMQNEEQLAARAHELQQRATGARIQH